MKIRTKAVLGGAALVIVAAVFAYYRFSTSIEVDVFEVKSGPIEEYVTAVSAGTVKSRRESVLSAEVGGRVSEVALQVINPE